MSDRYHAPDAGPRWLGVILGAAATLLSTGIMAAAVWKSSSYAAVIPFGVLAVVFGLRTALSCLPPARLPAEVAASDADRRDRRQAAGLAELDGPHLDVLARTAADDHGIADIETMSQRARAVTLALREPPDSM